MAKKMINAAEDVDLKNGCTLEPAGFASLFVATRNRGRINTVQEGKVDVVS